MVSWKSPKLNYLSHCSFPRIMDSLISMVLKALTALTLLLVAFSITRAKVYITKQNWILRAQAKVLSKMAQIACAGHKARLRHSPRQDRPEHRYMLASLCQDPAP